MKRILTVALVAGLSLALAGAAFAQMGGPGHMGGAGQMGGPMMMMRGGWAGPGMMAGPGQSGCPMAAAGQQQATAQVTEEQAKAAAQQYADQYLKGFTVERVLPFTGRGGAMYQVELKGPEGQARTLHVNPWGNVMPFGGPFRRAG